MALGLNFLKADVIIQRILVLGYLFAGLSTLVEREVMIYLLIIQFFLGGWQLLSSIILIAIRKDRKRITYFFGVLAYFAILFIGGTLMSQGLIADSKILMFISLILCPMSIAVWYFITTEKDYLAAKKSPHFENEENTNSHRQILDEGQWK